MEPKHALALAAEAYSRDPRHEGALAHAIRVLACATLKGCPADLAQDIAQWVTVRVLQSVKRGRVTPQGLATYTVAAARNRRLSFRRQAWQRRATFDDAVLDALADGAPGPEDIALREEESERNRIALHAALSTMPERCRTTIRAHYLEGRSIDALAAEEVTARALAAREDPGDPVVRKRYWHGARQTVDKRLSRGREILRQRLTERSAATLPAPLSAGRRRRSPRGCPR